MSKSICGCPTCGCDLEPVVRWARLVTQEPIEVAYQGLWGLDSSWTFGGVQVLDVRCHSCGDPSTVERNWPIAAA